MVLVKLLLTSSGIRNASICDKLVDLLGKPIAESSALFIPTGIYPFPGGAQNAFATITGKSKSRLCDLGWKSVGVLELTALPSIDREVWTAAVREADALLVWGGDPVYLSYWMKHSGLAELFPSLDETVYVGVSAGSIALATRFGETYSDEPRRSGDRLSAEEIVFTRPEGETTMTLVTAEGVGLVGFMVIPHVDYNDPLDAANAEKWAARLPVPAYAIDDDTAVAVADGAVEVVSEGHWKQFSRLGRPAVRGRRTCSSSRGCRRGRGGRVPTGSSGCPLLSKPGPGPAGPGSRPPPAGRTPGRGRAWTRSSAGPARRSRRRWRRIGRS